MVSPSEQDAHWKRDMLKKYKNDGKCINHLDSVQMSHFAWSCLSTAPHFPRAQLGSQTLAVKTSGLCNSFGVWSSLPYFFPASFKNKQRGTGHRVLRGHHSSTCSDVLLGSGKWRCIWCHLHVFSPSHSFWGTPVPHDCRNNKSCPRATLFIHI